jgi:hypothetical protein
MHQRVSGGLFDGRQRFQARGFTSGRGSTSVRNGDGSDIHALINLNVAVGMATSPANWPIVDYFASSPVSLM